MMGDVLTVQEYVESNGFEVSDFTEQELYTIVDEVLAINRGEEIVGGFFSLDNPIIYIRRGLKEDIAG